jgi:hypothetical protein
MINKAVPGTIDVRAINTKKPLIIFKKNENLNLSIESAKNIGCVMVNINNKLISSGREHIILGFIWQIIRVNYIFLINQDIITRKYRSKTSPLPHKTQGRERGTRRSAQTPQRISPPKMDQLPFEE